MKAYKKTTNSNHNLPIVPNLLKNPDLKIEDKIILATIPTQEGWIYHAIVIKKFVGYAFSEKITTDIVCSAFHKAISRQKSKDNLFFHSNCGSQYASNLFRDLLKKIIYCSIDDAEGQSLRQCCQRKIFLAV